MFADQHVALFYIIYTSFRCSFFSLGARLNIGTRHIPYDNILAENVFLARDDVTASLKKDKAF